MRNPCATNKGIAEGLLWYYLRKKQLGGYKFRRQQPVGPYIADFACLPQKLLIELDGGQHGGPNTADEQRDLFLRRQGARRCADPPPPQPKA